MFGDTFLLIWQVPEESSLTDLLLDMKEVVKEPSIEDVLAPFSNHEGLPPGLMGVPTPGNM